MYNLLLENLFNRGLNAESKLFSNLNDYIIDDIINSDDDNFYIDLSVPGLTKEQLKIVTSKNSLIISYENDDAKKNKFTLPFKKKYMLPKNILHDNITAKFENGICTITIPKDKEKLLERIIPIS